jgi:hypothetical protein
MVSIGSVSLRSRSNMRTIFAQMMAERLIRLFSLNPVQSTSTNEDGEVLIV